MRRIVGLTLVAAGLTACGGSGGPLAAHQAAGSQPSTTTTGAPATTLPQPTSTTTTQPPPATTTTTTTTLNLDPAGGADWQNAATTIKKCENTHQPSGNPATNGIYADVAGTVTNTGSSPNDYILSVSANVPGGFSMGTGSVQVNGVNPGSTSDWSVQIEVTNDPTAQLQCSVLDAQSEPAG